MKYKNLIYNILKVIWLIIGGLILLWTGFWFIQIYIIGNLGGVLVSAVMFGTGLYGLIIFIILNILFLLIKYGVKKLK